MFDEVVPGRIWASERPVKFGGVWLRSRTHVVKLSDGGLWVQSPSEPTAEMRRALDSLGPVRWLVIPNRFHHLRMPDVAACYPGARVIGPASVRPRNDRVRLHLELDDPAVEAELPELVPIPLAGVPYLDETVFFDRESGTLIGADLVLCACQRDHWSWRVAARLIRRYDKVKVPPDVRLLTRASDDTRRAIDRMLELPLERICVAHADPIDEQPAEKLARAWRFTR